MQLVAVILRVDIVADQRSVGQTKGSALLLTDEHALGRRYRTVKNGELVRVGEGFDGETEFLGAAKREVLDVVGVLSILFGTRWRLSNGRQTIPRYTIGVGAGRSRWVENAMINTGLVETITGIIPSNLRHEIYS